MASGLLLNIRAQLDADQALKSINDLADEAQRSYARVGEATDEVAKREKELQDLRDAGVADVRVQAARVAAAKKEEEEAIREAAKAYDEYERAAQQAGNAGTQSSQNFLGGLRGGLAGLSGAGAEAAGGFAEGFAGSAAIARLGAAGGPIGLALAAVAALGIGAGKLLAANIAEGMESLANKDLFAAQVGMDPANIGEFSKAAADAFTSQWGESIEQNMQAARFAVQGGLLNRDATDDDISAVIGNLQSLAQIMGVDVSEAARAAGQLMRGGFAESTEQAFDILVSGSQRGLDISGDWLDTVNEYSTQFRKLGLDGEEALGLLQQGLEGGARDTDIVADSMKEFSIRAVDGSKDSAEAFAALGFNAADMRAKFQQGGDTARTAFGAVLTAIRGLDSEEQKQLVWVRLFGTQWEDMGDAINRMDLSTARGQFTETEGAAKKAQEALGAHASGWDALGRQIDTTFGKLKEWLADTQIGRFFSTDLPRSAGMFMDIFTPTEFAPINLPAPDPNELPGMLLPGGNVPPPAPPAPGSPVRPDSGFGALFGFALPPPGTPPAPIPGAPVPGERTPIVPDDQDAGGSGGGAGGTPVIPSSRYSLDNIPIGGFPGAPGSLATDAALGAENALLAAREAVEQARRKLLELEGDDTATQAQLMLARNEVQQKERAYLNAQRQLVDAQNGVLTKMQDSAKSFASGMDEIGVALDNDLGISKGLPGIAENIVRFVASLAAAPLLGQLSAISQARPNEGSGLMGILGSRGAFGPAFMGGGGGGFGGGAGGFLGGLLGGGGYGGYPGDAALLARVPTGGRYDASGDLAQGLADCSSGIEDLINMLDGRPTAGRSMSTGNAAEWLTEHGFLPGMGGPGDFRVGYNSGHMQGTLPGGTPVNYGSTASIANRGIGGSGADDPSLTSHYYRPGGGYSGGPIVALPPVPPVVTSPRPTAPPPVIPTPRGGGGTPPPPVIAPPAPRPQLVRPPVTVSPTGLPTINSHGSPVDTLDGVLLPGGNLPPTPNPGLPLPILGGGGGGLRGGLGMPNAPIFGAPGAPAPPVPGGGGGTLFGTGGLGAGAPSKGTPGGPGTIGPAGGAPGTPGASPVTTGVPFPGSSGGGFQGLSGAPMDALLGAAGMADMIAPGAGAAAQIGIKLINRAIAYGGQVAGIGVSGLMQTFLPAGSERAANGWLPKIAAGIAGAKPQLPNMAGSKATPEMPPGALGPGGPPITTDASTTTNVTVNNNRATEDGTGRDLQFHLGAQNQAPGNR